MVYVRLITLRKYPGISILTSLLLFLFLSSYFSRVHSIWWKGAGHVKSTLPLNNNNYDQNKKPQESLRTQYLLQRVIRSTVNVNFRALIPLHLRPVLRIYYVISVYTTNAYTYIL